MRRCVSMLCLPSSAKTFATYLKGGVGKVVCLLGAGVSTSAGIPDFRSEGGLYSMLGEYNLPYPEAIFDLDYYSRHPTPFNTFARQLFSGRYKPTPTHHLLRLMADEGFVLRIYSQNIDSLECAAGIGAEYVIPVHGNLDFAACIVCG
eukprot:Sspe_Gene.72424::Locus_43220_Transcript_1_1_Confidence_1.000_Length_500::g.72424::m.72424/K11412/SIRT2, SIR2L2; NAD-dependent deacetylase sirtuin 2